MTEPKLKCPCGKRHHAQGSPRGATSRISEALNAQMNLYARDLADVNVEAGWARRGGIAYGDNHDWRATPMSLPADFQPMRIAVPRGMEQEFTRRWVNGASARIWDPVQHPAREREAQLAADRVRARLPTIGVVTARAEEHAQQLAQSLQEYMGIPQRGQWG